MAHNLEKISGTRTYESCVFPPFFSLHISLFCSLTHQHVHTHCLHLCVSFNRLPSHPCVHVFLRLVHSGPGKSSPLLDSDLSFGLRSGTKQGVETRVFRVDSAKELSTWTHLLVEGCHNAAELIKEVTTGTELLICLSPSACFIPTAQLLHPSV